MTEERIKTLFSHSLSWIFEHCNFCWEEGNFESYCSALHSIGFTKEEAFEELTLNCGYEDNKVNEVIEYIY